MTAEATTAATTPAATLTDLLTPAIVLVPPGAVLTVDGTGPADGAPFTGAVRALFAVRAALGARDDVPLEGRYAQHGDPRRFELDEPAGWHWRLCVPAPTGVDPAAAAAAGRRFGAAVVVRSDRPRLVAQLLHRGRHEDEAPSIARLEAFVAERGWDPVGPHTEVYLDDPRTTAPDRLRTLLRMPVR